MSGYAQQRPAHEHAPQTEVLVPEPAATSRTPGANGAAARRQSREWNEAEAVHGEAASEGHAEGHSEGHAEHGGHAPATGFQPKVAIPIGQRRSWQRNSGRMRHLGGGHAEPAAAHGNAPAAAHGAPAASHGGAPAPAHGGAASHAHGWERSDKMPTIGDVGPSEQILEHGHRRDLGNGAFTQTWAGASANAQRAGESPEQIEATGELASPPAAVTLAQGHAVASAGAQIGVRRAGEVEGRYGKAEGSAEASAIATAGARGQYSISSNGIEAQANAAARAGVEASVKGEVTSQRFLGTTAGAGASARGFAGVRAGAEGKVGITRDFVGAEGRIGGFAGAEGQAEASAHVGPVGVKGEVRGYAGVGAELAGEVTFKDGKLHISAHAALALGLGAGVGGTVEIDVREALRMGGELARIAHRFADRDGDGRLTLNDPATAAAGGMRGGAQAVDHGVDRTIQALDADGDGHFSRHDVALRAQQAGNAVRQGAQHAVEAGREAVQHAGQAVRAGAQQAVQAGREAVQHAGQAVRQGAQRAVQAGHEALDRDGDGRLGVGDIRAGAQQIAGKVQAAEQRVVDTARGAQRWAQEQGAHLREQAVQGMHAAHDTVVQAAQSAHAALDADGDGRLTARDAAVHAGHVRDAAVATGRAAAAGVRDAAVATGRAAVDGARYAGARVAQGVGRATQALHDAADRNGDGRLGLDDARQAVDQASQAIQTRVQAARQQVRQALDVNGDGKVDAADAGAAAQQARQRAQATFNSAVDHAREVAHGTLERGRHVAQQTMHTVQNVAARAHQAADRDGNGRLDMGDVRAGAQQAYSGARQAVGVVTQHAQAAYTEVRAQAHQARETLSHAVDDAAATLSGSWGKLRTFFGGR